MGPSILFDKSAIQSLSGPAVREVSRYFYTVVPRVLLHETLADLSLKPDNLADAKLVVARMADKVYPIDSVANADWRTMCAASLLGHHVPMTRTPIVFGGRPVTADNGSRGVVLDLQPENDAVMRWRSGRFDAEDLAFALDWRQSTTGTNLQAMKEALPPREFTLRTPEQVRDFVELMLADAEFHEGCLCQFLTKNLDPETGRQILERWRATPNASLPTFAPYACHCIRVMHIFYLGLIHGVFGTRPTNVVDLEYLLYTPFAFVFCSGDKLHRQMAPLVLQADQTFVERDDLRRALAAMADARESNPDAEPEVDSLIRQLWQKHWAKQPEARRQPIPDEVRRQMMEDLKPILEAIRQLEHREGPRFPV